MHVFRDVLNLWRSGFHRRHAQEHLPLQFAAGRPDWGSTKELFTLLDLCVSSLRRGHANLLCIVPILTDDPRRESECCASQFRHTLLEASPLPALPVGPGPAELRYVIVLESAGSDLRRLLGAQP